MKKFNSTGSALMQVLVLGALIATIVVVLLKFSITRTSNMIQTKNMVAAKIAMQGCLSKLNEEETRRIINGEKPFFEGTGEDNIPFNCTINNYEVEITRGEYKNNNRRDFSTGIVRPLKVKVQFFNDPPDNDEEGGDNEELGISENTQNSQEEIYP